MVQCVKNKATRSPWNLPPTGSEANTTINVTDRRMDGRTSARREIIISFRDLEKRSRKGQGQNNGSGVQLHHPSQLLKPWLKVKVNGSMSYGVHKKVFRTDGWTDGRYFQVPTGARRGSIKHNNKLNQCIPPKYLCMGVQLHNGVSSVSLMLII